MKIPKVYFAYAYPFDNGRRFLFESRNEKYPTEEEVRSETKRIEKMWREINKDDFVIKKIIEILGVNQDHDFEFAVFGAGMNPMSTPLLLPLYNGEQKLSDPVLIETIIHELIHRFIGPNRFYMTQNYWNYIWEKYDESVATRVHILVFAVLNKILPMVMSEKDILEVEDNITDPDYKKAYMIAKNVDPDLFVEEFKKRIIINL